jgi:hypothetical protein
MYLLPDSLPVAIAVSPRVPAERLERVGIHPQFPLDARLPGSEVRETELERVSSKYTRLEA